MTHSPLTVTVDLTLSIDPSAWQIEYGTPCDQVAADVQRYVRNSIQAQLCALRLGEVIS